MADHTREIKAEKLLLVEGQDEVHFMGKMCCHLGIQSHDLQIEAVGGKTKLRRILVDMPGRSGFPSVRSIGIIGDADRDPNGAFQSIAQSLHKLNDILEQMGLNGVMGQIEVPTRPGDITHGGVRAGVLILPNSDRTGCLEDLCLDSVVDDPAMGCVKHFLQCIQDSARNDGQRCASKAKAQVRAYLSGIEWTEEACFDHMQELLQASEPEWVNDPSVESIHLFLTSRFKPDLSLGAAAEAGYWNLDHEAFSDLRSFLRAL